MKVLIVDDDAMNRKLFRVLLQGSGYATIEAENGEEAVKTAKEKKPDLILMDIRMPVMDGITAFKALRREDATKDIPVIALTSYAMKGDRERYMAEGFDDYISKPIDKNGFIITAKRLLEQRIRGMEIRCKNNPKS
jgi:CheY-like chemotaxis protein